MSSYLKFIIKDLKHETIISPIDSFSCSVLRDNAQDIFDYNRFRLSKIDDIIIRIKKERARMRKTYEWARDGDQLFWQTLDNMTDIIESLIGLKYIIKDRLNNNIYEDEDIEISWEIQY